MATNITFPMQLVILMIGSVVSATVGVYASQTTLRSDIRNITTRMELQAKIDEERQSNLRGVIDELNRRQQLQQMEMQSLKESILSMKVPK